MDVGSAVPTCMQGNMEVGYYGCVSAAPTCMQGNMEVGYYG